MKTATNASARTAHACKSSLNDGLRVAFRAGAVMGLCVTGFALLDISVWFYLLTQVFEIGSLVTITTVALSFAMGASLQALFARVGGGIYTKAADVGADLVGKVEAGIPEDDPATRRPSPTTSATTSATWPAWAPTFTRATTVRSSPRRRWPRPRRRCGASATRRSTSSSPPPRSPAWASSVRSSACSWCEPRKALR
jgi:hypothetical protein